MKHLLIVEDDPDLSRGLCLALNGEDTRCESCGSLEAAGKMLEKRSYDLVLLDINLPDGSGLTLLSRIREAGNTPVILLTANDTEMDVVAGLEQGADDYITKPFSLAVLRARINARIRGRKKEPEAVRAVFEFGDYRLDFDRMEFFHGEIQAELSKTEQKALRILVENAGTTVPRPVLVDRIWTDGAEYVDENALSVTVKRLRDKLDAGKHIKTVYGLGYTWRID